MPLNLQWLAATTLAVDAAPLNPEGLAALESGEWPKLPLRVGNQAVPLGELFRIDGSIEDGGLTLEGDLRQLRRLGRGMTKGHLTVHGDVGVELGAEMAGGTIEVAGTVGAWAGAGLRGGMIRIRGGAGDFLGAAYPGSRSGMRDGAILVEGPVGDDAGLAMRRGLIAIAGSCGEGMGRDMIAGSVFAFGAVGRHAGAGMKRGTLALLGLADPRSFAPLPTFAPTGRYCPPFLTIYLRQLRAWGFPVGQAAFSAAIDRYNGDLATRGQGELLIAS